MGITIEINMLHQGNSKVAEAVREAAKRESIYEPNYDRCSLKNPSCCKLAPGLEGAFVADIASRLHRRIQEEQPEWAFHECIYMPSTGIEGKCGFDISVGHFERHPRVRLMHKLIQEWCDGGWRWDSNSECYGEPKVYRCADHISKLVTEFRKSGELIRPYLSFSVCFCLHEHRRMGREDIPPFEDDRRFLFLDLGQLVGRVPDTFDSKAPSGRLEVVHRAEAGESHFSARWVLNDGEEESLKFVNWNTFLNEAGEFLSGGC